MSEPTDLDDVVAAWREQPAEPSTFGEREIRRAARRIENEARTTVGAMVVAVVLTMGTWGVLAALADNALMRVGAALTALGYLWNAALAIHRHRQLATACVDVSELASIEYYEVLRDIDRRVRLAGAGWPAYIGMLVPPLVYFAGAVVAEPSSWPAIAAIAFIYTGFHAIVIPWGRRNRLSTYDEMDRYRKSRGLL